MKKVYGYVRVSTRAQNTDRQMLAMKEAGVPEAGIFVDHAVFITKLNK